MGMFGQNDTHRQEGSQTIIGTSVKVEGKFEGRGNVVVEGNVTGSIHTEHDLQIMQGAAVQADLSAKNVTIAGEVHGNIKAKDILDLAPTARVFGDVEGKTISVAAGAVLNGKCTMKTQQATETISDESGRERTKTGKASRIVEAV